MHAHGYHCCSYFAIHTSRSGSRPRRSSHKKSRNDSLAEEGEICPAIDTTTAAAAADSAADGSDVAATDSSTAAAAMQVAADDDTAAATASSNGVPNGEHAEESATVQQP
jgi:hypothetical protein